MYGYEEYIELTPEQILQKITQENIFDFILQRHGQKYHRDDRYFSPFRKDARPDCRFEERPDGTLLFVDFGEKHKTSTHRSCFRMVADEFNVSISGAIRIICNEFSLSTNINDYASTYNNNTYSSSNSELEEKEGVETDINYRPKPISKLDIIYWSGFIIKPIHLIEDNVFVTNRFTVKKPGEVLKVINVYKYCYVIDFIHHKKIYQPYSEKYRFITNCNENDIGNIDSLPATGDELIIQKAYKDHRVLRNIDNTLNVIWFQNEGCVPDIYILKNLTERFKLITIFFDSDEQGILAALKISSILEQLRQGCSRIVHMPVFISRQLTHKDPSEFVNKEGKADLVIALKQIKIL